jgi:hypothetical protein
MAIPRLIVDFRTREPITICCDDEEGGEETCIAVRPSQSTDQKSDQSPPVPLPGHDDRKKKGPYILYYKFAGIDDLLSHVETLKQEVPPLSKEIEVIFSLTVTGVNHLNLRVLKPLHTLVSSGYSVYLAVYD